MPTITTALLLFLVNMMILPSSLALLRSSPFWNHKSKYSAGFYLSPTAASNPVCDDKCDSKSTNSYNNEYHKIEKGEIYVREHFLSPAEVRLLREDIAQLQQQITNTKTEQTTTNNRGFQPSGLSNRVAGDRNEFGSSDRLTCTITPDLYTGNTTLSSMRLIIEEKLQDLRLELQKTLSKPRLELAEMYYSLSPKGSHLPRHQDERHEETKGDKGWINETRRSISWLIYLNENGWGRSTTTNKGGNQIATPAAGFGGELRAYVRKCSSKQGVKCGSHDGNIQVGWLRIESSSTSSDVGGDSTQEDCEYEPVFLDCWVKMPASKSNEMEEDGLEEDRLDWQAMSALYRIRTETLSRATNDKEDKYHQQQCQQHHRDYISPAFGPGSPSWPSDSNLEPTDFAIALARQLSQEKHRRRFVGVEDVRACQIVDVVPTGGTLVMFDSATVPHEVMEVQKGNRMAIAGWFHEAQQDFPEWYGS